MGNKADVVFLAKCFEVYLFSQIQIVDLEQKMILL
jgi:hypothetical protein